MQITTALTDALALLMPLRRRLPPPLPMLPACAMLFALS